MTQEKRNVGLLCGGGLDSCSLIVNLHKEIDKVIWVDYQHFAWRGEQTASLYFAQKYNLPFINLEQHQIAEYNDISNCSLFTGDARQSAYVNGRNLSLVMTAFEVADTVYLGHCDLGYEPFPDSTSEWIDAANSLLRMSFSNKSVSAPYINVKREDMLSAAFSVDEELFDNSWTCWHSNTDVPCGKCKHCVSKARQEQVVRRGVV